MNDVQPYPRRRGFTLLEIVIAVAILAILTGVALPLADKAFQSKAKRATRTEAEGLAEAAVLYTRDTLELPSAVEDLLVRPAGVAGWVGPYLPYTSDDPLAGESDWSVDAWSRDYELAVADDVLTIASGGPDGAVDGSDDVVYTVDARPIRRERTLAQLAVLNQAVRLYNDEHLPDDPLPTSYAMLLEDLVDSGFLPARTGFETDAWGDAFQPDPPDESPVVAVGSVHLGS